MDSARMARRIVTATRVSVCVCVCVASLEHHAVVGAGSVQTCSDVNAVCHIGPSDEVSYLQVTPVVKKGSQLEASHSAPTSSADQQAARLQSAKKVWWFHVPKCGSSFMDALIHLPGMCSPELPLDYVYDDPYLPNQEFPPMEYCFGSFSIQGKLRVGDHSAAGAIYDTAVKGHGVILLRQPEQRVLSGYYDWQHSWPMWYFERRPADVVEYAKVVSGCSVRMLVREELSDRYGHDAPSACGSLEPATTADLELAKQRLREGFPFVGITEEWELDICLLHAIFGGECNVADFYNMHPTNGTEQTSYDTSELKGYKDKLDGALYEEATAIFQQKMQQYSVTLETCQSCFQQAEQAKFGVK